jgi:hypothetical protein
VRLILEINDEFVWRALGWLGAGGGLLYLFNLVNLYRNRVRVRVWVLDEKFDPDSPPSVEFEAQNFGMTPTSIEPTIEFSGFLPRPTPERGIMMVWHELTFNIIGSQRTLAPFTPERFKAQALGRKATELAVKLGFTFFKTYTFTFSRGRKCRVHIRSADGIRISWSRYKFERFHFWLRGTESLPKPKEGSFELDS